MGEVASVERVPASLLPRRPLPPVTVPSSGRGQRRREAERKRTLSRSLGRSATGAPFSLLLPQPSARFG